MGLLSGSGYEPGKSVCYQTFPFYVRQEVLAEAKEANDHSCLYRHSTQEFILIQATNV